MIGFLPYSAVAAGAVPTPDCSDLRTDKLEYLAEVCGGYTASTRAVDTSKKVCTYSATEKAPCGCAVGRRIEDKELCKSFDGMGTVHHIFRKLPYSLSRFGAVFLRELQKLHDHEDNWNDCGLSPAGAVVARDIEQRVRLGLL